MMGIDAQIVLFWGRDFVAFYNGRYAPSIGLKHPTALGRPARENWAELWDDLHPLLRGVRETGETYAAKNRPFRIERRGYPETVFFDVSYSAVPDQDGTVGGVLCLVEETTERVVNEKRLRDSEARFQAMTNSIDQMIWSTLPDGFHDYYNQRWYEYTGVPEGSTDGEAWNGMFHPDDQDRAWSVWRHSLETGDPYRIEYRLRHRSGQYRWVLGRAQAVRDAQGAITRWFGTCTDIQEIVDAREVLSRSRTELEALVDATTRDRDRIWQVSQDLLGISDLSGVWTSINPAWTRQLGWEPSDIIGRTTGWLEHADDRDETGTGLSRVPPGETTWQFENRLRTREGDYRTLSWRATSVDGAIYYLARDVTNQRRLEDQLRQAQKMEAVGQLTGGLAHDFNNLLTGIIGSLDLMDTRMRQGRTTELDRYIGAAQGAAKRAAALTHRLLAFTRQQTLDPKPTDVNRLVAGLEDLLRRTVGPSIVIDVVGAGGLWAALIDQHQLENAILNLCINGRDAMPDGGRITIETANRWLDERGARDRELQPGQYVSICVTDTGTGMKPEVIERAFDPFFTTKPVGQGTGLGLSMIYGFARQSGGGVRIYSEVGRGTTMCIYLPRHLGSEEPQPAEARPQLHGTGCGETVLVVDDEPTVRMLVSEVLGDLGYCVLEAPDGAAALAILKSDERIDLLITDVGLPGAVNGRQVAETAIALRPGLPILVITGYAENAAFGNGFLPAGMELLTKPFPMRALATRIQTMIGRQPGCETQARAERDWGQ